MYSKKVQFFTPASSTFIFYKIILLVMNMLVFNFQNMTDIHTKFPILLLAKKKTYKTTI
jgi:hypothetical protein